MKQLKDNKLRTMTATTATTLSDKEFDNLFLEEIGEEQDIKADAYMRIHLETYNKIMDAVKKYKKITTVRGYLIDEDNGEEKEMKMINIYINNTGLEEDHFVVCDTTCYNMIMDNVDKELDDWNYDFASYQNKV